MDYDLTKTVQGKIEYNVDQAMPYGDFPPSMLMSRYEETDMGPDEDMYEDYARNTLCDWGPDQNKFEHEEARGGVNRRAGRLELQYYGHRGSQDTPYRPEIFDGFMGDEDRDPRGINVEPDMKEFRKQEEARMRFVRLTPDGADHITGGGRSEGRLMADQQKLFRTVRDRLKVFDRQIDGRRNGLRKQYAHKSNIPKQILVQSYGDFIKDYALCPQRRANIICREILRNSRAWREHTADADFAFAKYTQLCRRARMKPSEHDRVASARDGDNSRRGEISDQDNTKCYKAAGLLMANIVNSKRQTINNARGDVDFAEVQETAIRKTEPFSRDLALILRAMTQDNDFAGSDVTLTMKNPHPVMAEHAARQVVYNHLAPAHHYFNAEILYKSVKPGADTRKVKDLVITDANSPHLRDVNSSCGKTAKRKLVTGAKLGTADDADYNESSKTFNYRSNLQHNGDRRIRLAANDQRAHYSDLTQNRRPNHKNYRAPCANDTEENMRYGDNSCKERHTRGMGSKYLNHFIDRDSRADEISTGN